MVTEIEEGDNVNKRVGIAALVVYTLSVLGANWLIRNVGPVVIPGGNHLIPVGFGLMTTSGTPAACFTFVSRDLIQRTIGRKWSLAIIFLAAPVVAMMDVQLAIASTTAFLLGELLDYAVYTPLANRRWVWAIVLSAAAASVLDSVLFLGIAGIPLALALPGLLLARAYVVTASAPLSVWLRGKLIAGGVPSGISAAK